MSATDLPPELLNYIFRIATWTPASHKLFHTDYRPFHEPPGEQEREELRDADNTAIAIVRVCRQWRQLGLEFLYESIRLSHGMVDMVECLGSASEQGSQNACGQWVKRLELSVIEHEDPLHPVGPLDVLRRCPNVEVLVKYDDDLLPHLLPGARLTSIKRFDWWFARYRDGTHRFETEGDDRSRGTAFLLEVLNRTPNLQYLSLGRRYSAHFFYETIINPLSLPSLTTLRIEFIPRRFRSEIEAWAFPCLRSVIMDSTMLLPHPSSILRDPMITVVELLDDHEFLEATYLPTLLDVCQNLAQLNYCIQYTSPSPPSQPYSSLTCIGLHSKSNPLVRLANWRLDATGQSVWDLITAHFRMFTRSNFPSLERIVLYGNWRKASEDARFTVLLNALHEENIRLEHDA